MNGFSLSDDEVDIEKKWGHERGKEKIENSGKRHRIGETFLSFDRCQLDHLRHPKNAKT